MLWNNLTGRLKEIQFVIVVESNKNLEKLFWREGNIFTQNILFRHCGQNSPIRHLLRGKRVIFKTCPFFQKHMYNGIFAF